MKLRIAFYWLTMGPYHLERMRAIAKHPDVATLKVFQAAAADDHGWTLQLENEPFKIETLTERTLSRATEWLAFNQLRRLPKSERDVDVFVNGAGYTNLFLNQFLAKQSFLSLLWSESTARDNPDRPLRRFLKQQALKAYEGAIVAGTPHQKYLKQLGFDKPIAIVKNVVGTSPNPQTEKKNELLFVGRMIPEKNPSLLLHVFTERIAPRFPAWKLIMVGDGPLKNALVTNSNQVIFTGSLFGDDLQRKYNDAAIFVLPSRSEPWGLVVNEAMQSRCAVVASDCCGCIPDLLEPAVTGQVFASENADSLEKALTGLLEDATLRNRLAEAGWARVQEFSPEAYASRCVEFFKRMVAK
jgi:glycosyltransferase involved in cell wall biosynthesis